MLKSCVIPGTRMALELYTARCKYPKWYHFYCDVTMRNHSGDHDPYFCMQFYCAWFSVEVSLYSMDHREDKELYTV